MENEQEQVATKVASAVSDNETAVELFQAVLAGQSELSALEIAAVAKRVTTLATDAVNAILLEANKEFEILQQANEDRKKYPVWNTNAFVQTYTPRKKFQYPDEITEMEAKLKKLKKDAEDNGTALQLTDAVDPTKTKLFSVSLNIA